MLARTRPPELTARLKRRGRLGWMKAKRPLLDHFQSPCHQNRSYGQCSGNPGSNEVVPLFGPAAHRRIAKRYLVVG
jgi:hypothetical protein